MYPSKGPDLLVFLEDRRIVPKVAECPSLSASCPTETLFLRHDRGKAGSGGAGIRADGSLAGFATAMDVSCHCFIRMARLRSRRA
jgi:hypothetical protein